MDHQQVGTVDVLRVRIYRLDASTTRPDATTVVVEPGTYPLYRDADHLYWLMTGRINHRAVAVETLWPGTFALNGSDNPSGPEVRFPSKRFGPTEWAELLGDEQVSEGSPQQRIRITITEAGDQS